ncbi:hypothetical protein Z951_39035 [Streptomyces sp. PRh5]|nr:hypothetical protein Z951_39035 [Streptomyces sp. PRh5]
MRPAGIYPVVEHPRHARVRDQQVLRLIRQLGPGAGRDDGGGDAARWGTGLTAAPVSSARSYRPIWTVARQVDTGAGCSYTQVVVEALTVRESRVPAATTVYADGAVTSIRYDALSAGWSLHGNQDGAPILEVGAAAGALGGVEDVEGLEGVHGAQNVRSPRTRPVRSVSHLLRATSIWSWRARTIITSTSTSTSTSAPDALSLTL